MKIEEMLKITVDDDKWLEVVNGTKSARRCIDKEVLQDYIALKADGFYLTMSAPVDEIEDNILCDFNADERMGTSMNDLLDDCLDVTALEAYFETKNEEYCEEHNLCVLCRTKLKHNECPNGC
jgi:hypothetical protein